LDQTLANHSKPLRLDYNVGIILTIATATRTMKTIQISSVIGATLAAFLSLAAIPAVMADQYDGAYGGSSSSSNVYGKNAFADTSTTYYDGYQQAWRYLGWYVDCNGGSSRYYDRSGGGSQSGSGDEAVYGNNYCQRYLMWAAVSILIPDAK
jgi:hypothetical protein